MRRPVGRGGLRRRRDGGEAIDRVVSALVGYDVGRTSSSVLVRAGLQVRWTFVLLAVALLGGGAVIVVRDLADVGGWTFLIGGAAFTWPAVANWRWHAVADAEGWHPIDRRRASLPNPTVTIPWDAISELVVFRGRRGAAYLVASDGRHLPLGLPPGPNDVWVARWDPEDAVVREAHHLAHRLGVAPVPVTVDLLPSSGIQPPGAAEETGFWMGCATCDGSATTPATKALDR